MLLFSERRKFKYGIYGAILAGKEENMGYNHKRSYYNGKLYCSFHAEMDTILTWMSIFGKGRSQNEIKKLAKKFEIYIILRSK